MTAWPHLRAVTLALSGLIGLVSAGCGHGFGWEFWVGPRAPDPVVVSVDAAWLERSDAPHVSVFYDALAPHGVWTQDSSLGWVWSPSDEAYVPYTAGRWVETEAGPTFLCDTPHGWATAHYGRWLFRDRWYWVPDTRWGPAWVSWRVGEGFVGWAPLGPDVVSWTVPAEAWRFVELHELTHAEVRLRTYPVQDVPWLITRSRPVERAAQPTAGGFVVGPEVRFAGWRAHKVPLARLPQSKVRWVPRYERPVSLVRGEPTGVRAARAGSQRFGRKALAEPRKDRVRDRMERQKAPRVIRR